MHIFSKDSFYYVFNYTEHDLHGLLEVKGPDLTLPVIKCYMKQLIEGVFLLHMNHIVHRDLKAANILIDNKGHLQIADFGLNAISVFVFIFYSYLLFLMYRIFLCIVSLRVQALRERWTSGRTASS